MRRRNPAPGTFNLKKLNKMPVLIVNPSKQTELLAGWLAFGSLRSFTTVLSHG